MKTIKRIIIGLIFILIILGSCNKIYAAITPDFKYYFNINTNNVHYGALTSEDNDKTITVDNIDYNFGREIYCAYKGRPFSKFDNPILFVKKGSVKKMNEILATWLAVANGQSNSKGENIDRT